jgi:C-terminal processing protease CtpA/Prc
MLETPKLGVVLKEEDKKVFISGFAADSIAAKAGMKEDDMVLSLDDTVIESVDDVKIFLLFKNKSDGITVKVLRKSFLFGPAEKEFEIIL